MLARLQHIVDCFDIPSAPDKMESPTTELLFLGIRMDSVAMECRLPLDITGGTAEGGW